jgi:hypothetical protein
MNELPKVVFSNTLTEPLAWNNTRLIGGDLGEQMRALKRQSSDPLRSIGSITLVRSLIHLGLVDRFRVMIFPSPWGRLAGNRSTPATRGPVLTWWTPRSWTRGLSCSNTGPGAPPRASAAPASHITRSQTRRAARDHDLGAHPATGDIRVRTGDIRVRTGDTRPSRAGRWYTAALPGQPLRMAAPTRRHESCLHMPYTVYGRSVIPSFPDDGPHLGAEWLSNWPLSQRSQRV